MYKSYLDCYLGILEITCSDNYLESISLVKKRGVDQDNNISLEVKKQLLEYFDYKRTTFDLPINYSDTFRGEIYQALYGTYGETLSYKELAQKIDSKAYQAVGSAMANNPYFIVVP